MSSVEEQIIKDAIKGAQKVEKKPISGNIFKKINAIMKDIGSVGKDQKNSAQGYSFRGIDQFINHLHPILTKHGVCINPECMQVNYDRVEGKTGKVQNHTKMIMRYVFTDMEDGSFTQSIVAGEGLDPSDKATNKATSACLKYALIQTFQVPTEDMEEADKDSPSLSGGGSTSKKKVVKKVGTFRKPKETTETKEASGGGFG